MTEIIDKDDKEIRRKIEDSCIIINAILEEFDRKNIDPFTGIMALSNGFINAAIFHLTKKGVLDLLDEMKMKIENHYEDYEKQQLNK